MAHQAPQGSAEAGVQHAGDVSERWGLPQGTELLQEPLDAAGVGGSNRPTRGTRSCSQMLTGRSLPVLPVVGVDFSPDGRFDRTCGDGRPPENPLG